LLNEDVRLSIELDGCAGERAKTGFGSKNEYRMSTGKKM
jgi:hypothetical protein